MMSMSGEGGSVEGVGEEQVVTRVRGDPDLRLFRLRSRWRRREVCGHCAVSAVSAVSAPRLGTRKVVSGSRQQPRPSAVPGYRLPDHCRAALPARAAPHSLAVPKLENVVPMETDCRAAELGAVSPLDSVSVSRCVLAQLIAPGRSPSTTDWRQDRAGSQ